VADQAKGEVLQQTIGYHFVDAELLRAALTHKSYSNEQPGGSIPHSERLEFLGDAVLDLAVSARAFRSFPEFAEGELTRVRAEIVSEANLARVARKLRLGAELYLGRGEERSGGRDKDSLLADACEALLGAVFCDGGFLAAHEVVERLFGHDLDCAARCKEGGDYKTRLQELLQGRGGAPPLYRLTETLGPDHQRTYQVEVHCGDEPLGCGSGRSKKAAEQAAAREALDRLQS
jgi:ribonuclease-3